MKVGTTVKLKSGGPIMTITDLNDGGGITCSWFASDQPRQYGKPDSCSFPKEALVEVPMPNQ